MTAIKVHARRATNGDPRAGWILYDESGEKVAFIPGGYQGDTPLRAGYPDAVVLDEFKIPVGAFKRLERWATR